MRIKKMEKHGVVEVGFTEWLVAVADTYYITGTDPDEYKIAKEIKENFGKHDCAGCAELEIENRQLLNRARNAECCNNASEARAKRVADVAPVIDVSNVAITRYLGCRPTVGISLIMPLGQYREYCSALNAYRDAKKNKEPKNNNPEYCGLDSECPFFVDDKFITCSKCGHNTQL